MRKNTSRNFTILVIVILAILIPTRNTQAWPVKSYRELRYKHVRAQNTLSSCGPASLATLFGEFYGKKIKEEKIVKLIKPYLDEEIEKLKEGEVPEGGVSMLDLKKVSSKLGVLARGYEIPRVKLLEILEKIKTPLLIYLKRPEKHFVLAIGGYKGKVILADPSLGIRSMGQNELFDKWEGLMLAFSPDRDYKNRSYQVIKEIKGKAKQRNQTKNLAKEFL